MKKRALLISEGRLRERKRGGGGGGRDCIVSISVWWRTQCLLRMSRNLCHVGVVKTSKVYSEKVPWLECFTHANLWEHWAGLSSPIGPYIPLWWDANPAISQQQPSFVAAAHAEPLCGYSITAKKKKNHNPDCFDHIEIKVFYHHKTVIESNTRFIGQH